MKMSAELYLSPEPAGNNGSLQNTTTTTTTTITTTGGTKPFHRFIKGQPKIIGIIVLVLGTSIFIVAAINLEDRHTHYMWSTIPPGFLQGTLYIICGSLYILTEHTPTKKTVTLSLALSIVTFLVTCWTILNILPGLEHYNSMPIDYLESLSNFTEIEPLATLQYMKMGKSLEIIFFVKFFFAGIIFIVMSALGGMALRSTNGQAIVMTNTQTETEAE